MVEAFGPKGKPGEGDEPADEIGKLREELGKVVDGTYPPVFGDEAEEAQQLLDDLDEVEGAAE